MSLLGTNTAILLLKKDRLQLFTKQASQQLIFPPEIIRHQEIIDQKLFEKILTEFFTQSKNHEGTLILDEDIIFQKQLPLAALPEEMQSFYDTIPFPQNQIAKKMVKTNKNMYLLATNRDLYQTIVHIAKQYQWEIKEVLPLTIFMPFIQTKELSYQALTLALKHKEFANTANFLKEETVEKTEKPTNAVPLKQYFILIVCLLFLFLVLGVAAQKLELFPSAKQNNPKLPTTVPLQSNKPTTPITIATPSTEQVQNKKTVAIQIVNGSGINGQATLVKEHLASLGYTNAQIGNTNIATSSTTIVFSKTLNSSFVAEIMTELQKLFTTVNSQSTTATSGYDILITTGGGTR